jgi:hypothetical protein
MRTHLVAKGTMYPMPPLIKGDVDKVTQGGLPPEPYRSANHKWCRGAKFAREPYASQEIKREVFHSTSVWDATKRQGRGAWVAP